MKKILQNSLGKLEMAQFKDKAPCKDCEDRYVGCHSDCDKYSEYVRYKEKLKQKEREENINTSSGWGYIPRKKRKHD